jgi:hypothetical protein
MHHCMQMGTGGTVTLSDCVSPVNTDTDTDTAAELPAAAAAGTAAAGTAEEAPPPPVARAAVAGAAAAAAAVAGFERLPVGEACANGTTLTTVAECQAAFKFLQPTLPKGCKVRAPVLEARALEELD